MEISHSRAPHPLETVLKWLKANEIFFHCPETGLVFFHFDLENLSVRLMCRQLDSGKLALNLFFPIKAHLTRRPMVGEFLHRLNFVLTKPILQFDHGDGEVRISVEICLGPNSAEQDFHDSLFPTLFFADKIFPYLNSVVAGSMSPEIAADQTAAALQRV